MWAAIAQYCAENRTQHLDLDDLLTIATISSCCAVSDIQPLLRKLAQCTPSYVRIEDVRYTPTAPVSDRRFTLLPNTGLRCVVSP